MHRAAADEYCSQIRQPRQRVSKLHVTRMSSANFIAKEQDPVTEPQAALLQTRNESKAALQPRLHHDLLLASASVSAAPAHPSRLKTFLASMALSGSHPAAEDML